MVSRGRLLLGLGNLFSSVRGPFGPYHDGCPAANTEDRMRVGHQLHGHERHLGDEHPDEAGGHHCNLPYRVHVCPRLPVSGWCGGSIEAQERDRLGPLGRHEDEPGIGTAGATFQSLMTVVKLSRAGVLVSVTTYLCGNGWPPSVTHT